MLSALDGLVGTGSSRSRLVRAAIGDYLARETKRQRETAERKIWEKHQRRLERQARALVAEQAEP
jgi:metal-responsive CopG/Arc/MetJ family transcriptional regulator